MSAIAVPAGSSPAANPLLLNLTDASPVAGLTVWQLRALIASGEMPVVRVGRKLYVHRQALIRWADRAQQRHKAKRYVRRSAKVVSA